MLLFDAVQEDSILWVKKLLQHVNETDTTGKTALHVVQSRPVARLLVDAGARIDQKDQDGNTPLHTVSNHIVAAYLIECGACISAKNADGRTPLHSAKTPEIIKLLVDAGADPNATCGYQFNALHLACSWGKWQMVRILLQVGVSIEARDKFGRSVFDILKQVNVTNAQDTRALVITTLLLNIWNQDVGCLKTRATRVDAICSWKPLAGVCKQLEMSLAKEADLPTEIVREIVEEYIGPWSAAPCFEPTRSKSVH